MNANSLEAFQRRLDKSRFSTFLVAQSLHKKGYSIHIPAFSYRPENSDWRDHVDSGDLYAFKDNNAMMRIDVKHIATDFTNAKDFPYDRMFVADIRAIRRADPHPEAYVIVNKAATHVGIIWWKTQRHWAKLTVHASNTDKDITVMACPLEYVDFRCLDLR